MIVQGKVVHRTVRAVVAEAVAGTEDPGTGDRGQEIENIQGADLDRVAEIGIKVREKKDITAQNQI